MSRSFWSGMFERAKQHNREMFFKEMRDIGVKAEVVDQDKFEKKIKSDATATIISGMVLGILAILLVVALFQKLLLLLR